jgi:arabinan endo-1,5-alpha-L-arabinosidase
LRPVPAAPRHLLRSILAALAILALAPAGIASASTLRYQNPLRDAATGKPLSCPDPSVVHEPAVDPRYLLVCTSAFAANAIPIYASPDLVHWRSDGFVFPRGHQPWWAVNSGPGSRGQFWAPEMYRIGDRWVVYFAAEYNTAKLDLEIPGVGRVGRRTMVVGDAWANSLQGPWHTGILHYRGQLNGVSSKREDPGPAIDPSVVQDPGTGRLYLFWADRPTHIWAGELSATGLSLDPQIHPVLSATEPFDCDPLDHHCTVEGPEPFYANGMFYLLYSGGSTWDASYDVGVASAPGPFGPFVSLGHPILRQGFGFYGTGHTSHPVVGPDGNTYILYHARTSPGLSYVSDKRLLMLGRFGWAGGWPTIT